MSNKRNPQNLITIRRSNKLIQALNLPKVLVLNPRSVYNKLLQLKTFIVEHDIDVICLSESWEREDLPLDKVLHIENHEIELLV